MLFNRKKTLPASLNQWFSQCGGPWKTLEKCGHTGSLQAEAHTLETESNNTDFGNPVCNSKNHWMTGQLYSSWKGGRPHQSPWGNQIKA